MQTKKKRERNIHTLALDQEQQRFTFGSEWWRSSRGYKDGRGHGRGSSCECSRIGRIEAGKGLDWPRGLHTRCSSEHGTKREPFCCSSPHRPRNHHHPSRRRKGRKRRRWQMAIPPWFLSWCPPSELPRRGHWSSKRGARGGEWRSFGEPWMLERSRQEVTKTFYLFWETRFLFWETYHCLI